MKHETNQFECAFSGLREPAEMESDNSDGLEDLPIGWTSIRIQRRTLNPKWVLIQQMKEGSVQSILEQIPEEYREMQEAPVRLQVEAQLFVLEQSTPKFILDVDDEVYVGPYDSVQGELDELRDLLGLPALQGESARGSGAC